MGLAYYSGSIVEKDREKSLEYWQKAADLGSLEAKVRIAYTIILEKGRNVNYELSVLQAAVDEGSVSAESALGYCYENGLGVSVDKAMAANYYRRAAQRGSEAAYHSLIKMYDEIRPTREEFQIFNR
jgi:TPR repeat protein